VEIDETVKSRKSDGTVKSFRCKARKSDGMRRTDLYAAMTEDAAQRRRWTFYEAVKIRGAAGLVIINVAPISTVTIAPHRHIRSIRSFFGFFTLMLFSHLNYQFIRDLESAKATSELNVRLLFPMKISSSGYVQTMFFSKSFKF